MSRRAAQPFRAPQNRAVRPSPLFEQARSAYSRNAWSEAEPLCRALLRMQPGHFGALTLLGIIAVRTRRATEAAELLGRAARVAEHNAEAHNNYGNALRDLARHEEALESYDRALSIRRDYGEAHYNRGVTLHALARHEEALECYDRALALQPDYAAAHNNRGVTLRELKRPLEALESYDRALQIDRSHAGACNNRGVTLQQLERIDEAVASYQRALTLSPDDADVLRNLGAAWRRIAAYDKARHCYHRALHLNQDDVEAHHGLGVTLQLADDASGALESFDRALALDPSHAEAHFHRGNLLRGRGQLGEALAAYERALANRPTLAEVHKSRGAVLHEVGRVEESLRSYERALELSPESPWLPGICLSARMQVCNWAEYDARLADLRRRIEANESVATPFNAVTLIDSAAVQRRVAEHWAARTCRAPEPMPRVSSRARGTRLRIGYYSADFYNHATMVLAEELFAQHDRERFEIFGFQFGHQSGDAVTQRVAGAFDHFIDVRDRSDLEIARLSRERGIDIAVDLKGFTQHNRVGIFVNGAARIQVNYLGFPGTLGAPYIDYLIADRTVIPEDSRRHYVEKIVYLPDSYQVNGRGRQIADRHWSRTELGLPPQGFVFCCFNNVYKITPDVFDTWMRVLGRVDGSVLWLLDGGEAAKEHLRAAAEASGVHASRLHFAPRIAPPEHLARHRMADLFIDTAPCNAHTTASDALWAGLPVVTRAGEAFASRVAASLLIAVGLPELITHTSAQYEALLVNLATDPARLAAIRTRLQHDRLHTPLFDVRRYARHLEQGYVQMYQRLQAGLPPEHLCVTPSCLR